MKEKDSLSSLLQVNGGVSLPEGKVPSKRASSWFCRLTEKLLVGSKESGGAIWTCGGGRDTTVFTGIVVILAVTGLILKIGEGSSLVGREISVYTKENRGCISRKKKHTCLTYCFSKIFMALGI